MQARIQLLSTGSQDEKICTVAEEILTDISVAFNHSFTLMREKIGQSSIDAYNTPLTEETVSACADSDAAIVCRADCAGQDDLLSSLRIPCRMRIFPAGDKRCYLIKTMALDAQTLSDAMQIAFETAKREELPLRYVLPSGKSALEFKLSITSRLPYFPDVAVEEMSPAQAAEFFVLSPESNGVFVFPPYAGGIFFAENTALQEIPMYIYERCEGNCGYVYSPVIPPSIGRNDEVNPSGICLAISDLLRYALKLEKEADCVESAIRNVLEAGWRTPDMSDQPGTISTMKMLQLISEQITLAGQLMQS